MAVTVETHATLADAARALGSDGATYLGGGTVVVEHLLRDGLAASQLLRTGELPIGHVLLGLALRDDGHSGRPFGLPLGHHALRRFDADFRAPQLRLGLAALGLELRRVHAGQHLAGSDELAFTGQDFPHSP